MNTAARGARRRRALARRRRAPTGSDQSHEDGANRDDTPLPDFDDTPPTKRTPSRYLVNNPLLILDNAPLPLVEECQSPPHKANPLSASQLPTPRCADKSDNLSQKYESQVKE